MPAVPPGATFGDLKRLELAVEVTCQRCGNIQRMDGTVITIAHRRIAGARYRCAYSWADGRTCGGIGLPTVLPAKRYAGHPGRLARARRNV
jgi:hypothetical protein